MGATDVIPFIPVADVDMDECIEIARQVGKEDWRRTEHTRVLCTRARQPGLKGLTWPRLGKGQYEGFFEKIKEEGLEARLRARVK
jgi:glutamate formiminotransferase